MQRLLAEVSVENMDAMSHEQLAWLAQQLGLPPAEMPRSAALVRNWQALRTAFPNPKEVQTLMLGQPLDIARFLVNGPAQRRSEPSAQPAQGVHALLKEFSIAEMDRMPDKYLAMMVGHLGLDASQIPPDARFADHWKSLRQAFPEASDMQALMLTKPLEVAKFLVEGPGPQARSARAAAAAAAAADASSAQPPAFELAKAPRDQVVSELAARGLSKQDMLALKSDFHDFINHGGDESRRQLSEKYGQVIKDDLAADDVINRIARNLLAVKA